MMRTIAARQAPTVRANPLKTNEETVADGADANLPSQSVPGKTESGWREGYERRCGPDGPRAAGVQLALDGNDLC